MEDVFYSIGIISTFFLSVWNIVNNYRLSRRTAFINTVTAERVKWIETLRKNISEFCGLSYTWHVSRLEDKPEELGVLKQIDMLRHLIRLQVNPEGTHDKEIERLIAQIPELTHESKTDEFKNEVNNLVEVSQKLLKEEWETVKKESKRGDLKETEHCLAPILRKLNAWCVRVTSRFSNP